jgi:branched-subunit amino acid transport protein
MSWALVLILAATAFGFKVLGVVIIGDRVLPPVLGRCLSLIPPALVAAIVVRDTFTVGQGLGINGARVAGVGVAVVAASRKAPLIAVIVLGAGTTALIRAVS